jgi:hypothetical protein
MVSGREHKVRPLKVKVSWLELRSGILRLRLVLIHDFILAGFGGKRRG